MTDLPTGWARTTVKDVAATMFDGPFGSALKTSDYTDDGMRVARLENIGHLTFRGDLKSFVSATKGEELKRHLLRRADVLFSSFVDRQTRVCLVPDDLDNLMINKADCFCVRVDPRICDPRFLAYRLAAPSAYDTFRDAVKGVTRPRIGMRDLAAFELELPPVAEQQRIVAKLDALTARTARARADLDRIPALAARYKQAALTSVLGPVAAAAKPVPLQALLAELTSGSRDWARYYDRGTAIFVLAGNVRPMRFDTRPKRFVDPPRDGADARRSRVLEGDLLLTIVGAGTGDLCAVPPIDEEFFICQSVALLRLRQPELAQFLEYWFQAEAHGRGAINEAIYGAARPHLSFDDIRGFQVPDVNSAVAAEAVLALDRAFTEIDRLVADAAAARRLLDRLDQSVLAKAFRGELVPQDPADEPASVLLDRIRAGRAASPAKVRRGRPVAA